MLTMFRALLMIVVLGTALFRGATTTTTVASTTTTVAGTTTVGSGTTTAGTDFCNGMPEAYYCLNCLTPIYCKEGTITEMPKCGSGQVCEEFSSFAACSDVTTSSKCYCTSNSCDPYGNYADLCISQGIYDVQDCGGSTCNAGECGDTTGVPPDVTSCDGQTVAGWHLNTQTSCSSAIYCTSSGEETASLTCESGQYVDENGQCQTAPPSPCSGSCSGYCADYTDCQSFYVCDGAGNVFSGPTACPTDEFFNPQATPPSCVAGDSSVCSQYTNCGFESSSSGTTSSGSSSTGCSDAGVGVTCDAQHVGNYEYAACDQRYCSCTALSGGSYGYIEMMCPNDLYFNGDSGYCESACAIRS